MTDLLASAKEAIQEQLFTRPREPEDWLSWEQVEQPVEDEAAKMSVSALENDNLR